ncbi:hypothetical protein ACFE04_015892 [Oxalis oulophora]
MAGKGSGGENTQAASNALKRNSSSSSSSSSHYASSRKDKELSSSSLSIASRKDSSLVDGGGGGGGGTGGGAPHAANNGNDFAQMNAPASAPNNNAAATHDHMHSRAGNAVLKSGPLFISSKGIGWTSWKKRWFILTRTSLVFFRSDPSAIPQRGSDVNLTLGGIDLNNSGSVEIKADKKLLTVLFPDGRDGRAFTLKRLMTLSNSFLAENKHQPGKSVVVGRPVLLALEEIDGTPSFLEKALNNITGVKVEGLLRQAASVDDVERRIREYEQGNTEFLPGEDAHVIGDCVKYVIRELPSSPVPASCCRALLEACKTERSGRLNAMRTAITETFPEPNRRLLQRILSMMQIVASHKAVNRMSTSAVAACMAPLLLRPLLAGDCDIDNDFDVGGDGSVQLLQAAAAANHAQAIVITLLEEYNNIFMESTTPNMYSDTEDSGNHSDESDDDESYEDDEDYDGDEYTDDDLENGSGVSYSDSGDSIHNARDHDKGSDDLNSSSKPIKVGNDLEVSQKPSKSNQHTEPQGDVEISQTIVNPREISLPQQANQSGENSENVHKATITDSQSTGNCLSNIEKSSTTSTRPVRRRRNNTVWGHTSSQKNISMESYDFSVDDEDEIQTLEATKCELQNKIAEEIKGNDALEENLEDKRKKLTERRLALEKDVESLEEQLQKVREKRKSTESKLRTYDEMTRAILEELAQAAVDTMSLKQRVESLSAKLTQLTDDSAKQAQQSTDSLPNQKVKLDNKATAAPNSTAKSISKDTVLDGAETASEKKKDSTSSSNKPPSRKEQADPYNSVPTEQAASKLSGSNSNSKKSGAKDGEKTVASSAITKLSSRLNFLKERRTQIANELQNRRSEEKGRLQIIHPGESGRPKGQAVKNESFMNSQSLSGIKTVDEGKRLESHNPHVFETERSEGHISQTPEDVELGGGPPRLAR